MSRIKTKNAISVYRNSQFAAMEDALGEMEKTFGEINEVLNSFDPNLKRFVKLSDVASANGFYVEGISTHDPLEFVGSHEDELDFSADELKEYLAENQRLMEQDS